mgnify:FL=1
MAEPPVCTCQKHQRISAAHALRESAAGDPALLLRGLANVLAGHLERHHPELRGVQMAAEEAEYRGILGL